jgi:predicted Na+-dependent transporter
VENAAMAMLIGLRHFDPLTALPSIVYGKVQYIIASTVLVSRFKGIEDKQEADSVLSPGSSILPSGKGIT